MESVRGNIIDYARTAYGVEPDRPFATATAYEVLRHTGNRKWFALFMDVPRSRLGLPGEERVDILNLKCDPVLAASVRDGIGIFPGYHMNRASWITVLLDSTVPEADIRALLGVSYELTRAKPRPQRGVPRITSWLIPANPKFYDIDTEIAESADKVIRWKQSSNVAVGDTVYIYEAAPVSAVKYKCRALEVNIPYEYADENVSMSRVMRLEVLEIYDGPQIGRDVLARHGVRAVRGPRSMPSGLEREIALMYRAADRKPSGRDGEL